MSARLVLDDQIKGDVGVVSEDLFKELFPRGRSRHDGFLPRLTSVRRDGPRQDSAHRARPMDTASQPNRRYLVPRSHHALGLHPRAVNHTLLTFFRLSPAIRRYSTEACAFERSRSFAGR